MGVRDVEVAIRVLGVDCVVEAAEVGPPLLVHGPPSDHALAGFKAAVSDSVHGIECESQTAAQEQRPADSEEGSYEGGPAGGTQEGGDGREAGDTNEGAKEVGEEDEGTEVAGATHAVIVPWRVAVL